MSQEADSVLDLVANGIGSTPIALRECIAAHGDCMFLLRGHLKPVLGELACKLPQNQRVGPSTIKSMKKDMLLAMLNNAVMDRVRGVPSATSSAGQPRGQPATPGLQQTAKPSYPRATPPSQHSQQPRPMAPPPAGPVAAFFQPAAQAPQPLDPRLNTTKKVRLFKVMLSMGLRRDEVLKAVIALCPGGDDSSLTEDMLLTHILAHRDGGQIDPVLAQLKAQEDADMDRAILESEAEREAIQMRKRRRTEEIKSAVTVSLLQAEELKGSVLLFGLPLRPAASASAASTTSSSSSSSSSDSVQGSADGCALLQLLAYLLEHCTSESSLHSLCSAAGMPAVDIASVRQAMAALLLVEAQALKYYKEEAHPHLLYVCSRLDASVPLDALLKHRALFRCKPEQTIALEIARWLLSHQQAVRRALHNETYLFERGLAKLPSGGHSLPDLLRYQRLRPFMDLLHAKVDQDGFEFIAGKDGIELLPDALDVEDLASDTDTDGDD